MAPRIQAGRYPVYHGPPPDLMWLMTETQHVPRVRWARIEKEIRELYEGKVQAGDPVEREGDLLVKQGQIEYLLG